MKLSALLLALVLLVPIAMATTSLVRTISPGAGAFNGLQLALADFRGDGHVEVVAQSDDGKVYVVDPMSGAVLATFAPGNAGCTSTCYSFEGVNGPINAPIVADVDRDGNLDVIVADTAAVVARFSVDVAASTSTSLVFHKVWEHRYNSYQSFTTMDAAPVVADLNGDGKLEVVVVTEEVGVFAIRPDGSTLWQTGATGGHATPSVRDLDGDGKPEVVVARDDGKVMALNGATGSQKWIFDASAYVWPASIPMAPTLSDINGDGKPDVLFMARDAHDATTFTNDHFVFFALDYAGHLLWKAQPSWGAPLSHTRPILVSVNGQRMILGGDWNTIGHKPGNFERVGPGHVFLFDATGHEVWHRDLNAAVSDKDIAVADVVGDGTQQVIAAGTQNGAPGLLLFDLATGASRGFLATPTPTRSTVAIGNLAGDGHFAMAVAVASAGGSIQVWQGPQTLRAAFPGWGALSIPRSSTVATPPPTSTGNFTATFGPKGNEWWVETSVQSTHTVASVRATINGGAPVDLPKTSWGAWAKSIHAVSGSIVQFSASDSGGAVALSPCYQWITFSVVACSGSSPPPPAAPPNGTSTLSATFTPHNGNEWWEQVHVSASESITAVDVRVNGGTWNPMKLQSYGDWTVSVHAVAGSAVEFRATGASGAQAVSQKYVRPQ